MLNKNTNNLDKEAYTVLNNIINDLNKEDETYSPTLIKIKKMY